jgi:hypothetical protein
MTAGYIQMTFSIYLKMVTGSLIFVFNFVPKIQIMFKKRLLFVLKIVLLLLYIGYYSSVTLFYHAHLVDGKIVCHSHPFRPESGKKGSGPSHTHTANALFSLQRLCDIGLDDPKLNTTLGEPSISCAVFEQDPLFFFWFCQHVSTLIPRAPPVC